MKWAYDLTGAEPIIKDEPIYDATTIVNGELVMKGTGNFTGGADCGIAFVSGGSASNAVVALPDALGICTETKTTADTPSIAAAHNTVGGSVCYGKCIVNPFAVYRAAVSNSASTAVNGSMPVASGSTIQIAVTGSFSTTASGIGSWVIFTATAGPNYGVIRKVALAGASAGTANLDATLPAAPTTADRVIIVRERNQFAGSLTPDGLNIGTTIINTAGCTSVRVVDNYIDRGVGLERLTMNVHAAGSAVDSRPGVIATKQQITAYQDVMLRDHIFGVDL